MSAAERLRLFVAAPIPPSQLRWLDRQLAPLKSTLRGARWIDPANQHVTLKFLGGVGADLLDDVVAVADRVAQAHAAQEVRFSALGAFPSTRRASVLWAGLVDDAALLERLAGALSEGYERLGFVAEKRPFRAHLTVARFKAPARLDALPELAEPAPFRVEKVSVYRSRLHPTGARYEVIHESYLLANA